MSLNDKYYVHVGSNPEPKEVDEPGEAIALAERCLIAKSREIPEHLIVAWRRDDLYPKNFIGYLTKDLVSYLENEGEVVLQLVEIQNGLPIMGEIVNIFTAAEEERNIQEAQQALKHGHTYQHQK